MSQIHSTAIVSPKAKIGDGVIVGPYSIIEDHAVLGDRCSLGPHVHILGRTVIGNDNRIHTGGVLGGDPQHHGYQGEDTQLIVGDRNSFREHFTANKGWGLENPPTCIGSDNMFMSYSHVAHNAQIGNGCVFTNNSAVAGHVVIQDGVILGGAAMVHQFCRVGRFAMIGGQSSANVDVPPFFKCVKLNTVDDVNTKGMRRNGFSRDSIEAVTTAFRLLYTRGLKRHTALEFILEQVGSFPEVQELVHFIRESKRGVTESVQSRRMQEVSRGIRDLERRRGKNAACEATENS